VYHVHESEGRAIEKKRARAIDCKREQGRGATDEESCETVGFIYWWYEDNDIDCGVFLGIALHTAAEIGELGALIGDLRRPCAENWGSPNAR
jgi:hypothetical protein